MTVLVGVVMKVLVGYEDDGSHVPIDITDRTFFFAMKFSILNLASFLLVIALAGTSSL